MPPPSEKRGRKTFWAALTILIAGIAFVLGGFAAYHYYGNADTGGESSGPVRPATEPDKVVALGRIAPKGDVLSLGVPMPDRITRIKVKEGQQVKKGEELVILDGEVMRDLERKLAVIQREQAEKRLKAIEASGTAQIRVEEIRQEQVEQVGPLEIQAQMTKIKFLEAQQKNVRRDYERYVAAGDTVADQDKDKQRLLLDQVETELAAARCEHAKMLKSRDFNRELAKAQLTSARADLERGKSAISLDLLDKQIKQAEERVRETQVRAPTDGKILRILIHEGELVRGQPILQIANTEQMIVLTEVYETDIQRVKIGQKATITSHIFKRDDALTGKVVWKASSIGKAQVIALDPRAAMDNRVAEVKVALDQSERVADLIGHQVHVEIDTGPPADSRK
jgi:HlyD family secretion protein